MVRTEWGMQETLTREWVERGVQIDGVRHFLVAWEVMFLSWRINDAAAHWAEPSIDFIAADRNGRLVAIELKREVAGIKRAWRVLCQVTHRAVLLARSITKERLEATHRAC